MKRIVIVVVCALALLGVIGWKVVGKQKQAAQAEKTQLARKNAPPNVKIATAGPRVIEQTVDSVGTVESPFNVKLSPKVAGPINYLEVREGAIVKTGEVLVRIDPTETQGQVVQAQAAVAEARSRLAQAAVTTGATNQGIASTITQNEAGVESSQSNDLQVRQNYAATVGMAKANVTDAEARVASAEAALSSAEADYNTAKANQTNAEAKYSRTYSLYQQQFIAAQDLDDARTAMLVARATAQGSQKRVAGARSALNSSKAQLRAAQANESIAEVKGKADIAAADAQLKQTKASYKSALANREQVPAYQANIAALRADVSVAEAQLAQAQARLQDTSLASPIDGVVTARAADPGSLASPGTAILTIQYLKWLYVTTSLPIEDSSKVVVGSQGAIQLDALPGRVFRGAVIQVSPAADPQSRQFLVRFKLDNANGVLRPGMYAHVQIVTGRIDAAVVAPREAIATGSDGGSTVKMVDSNMVVHIRPVKVGQQDSKGIQILEGLQPGDKVVVLSYLPVRDGQKVRQGGSGGGGAGGQGGASKRGSQ